MRSCPALNSRGGQKENRQKDVVRVSTLMPAFGIVVTGRTKIVANSIFNSKTSRVAISRATVDKVDFRISGANLLLTLVPGESAPPEH